MYVAVRKLSGGYVAEEKKIKEDLVCCAIDDNVQLFLFVTQCKEATRGTATRSIAGLQKDKWLHADSW